MSTILAPVNEPKLRVLILGLNYAPEPTGNAPYTTSLAEGLARQGHKVRVITGYPHYPEWRLQQGYSGWSSQESANEVDVRRLRHFIPRRPGAVQRLWMELSFGLRVVLEKWGTADIVLVVSPALFASGLALAKARLLRSKPATAIWIQDIYSRGIVETGSGSALSASVAGGLESLILRSADAVIAIHERFRQFLVDSLHVDADRVSVVRNWTHLPESDSDSDKSAGVSAEVRAKLGWGRDEIIVLHAGNMGKKQGLQNVVDAARLSQEVGSKVRFVLMGDGNQRKRLENEGRGLNRLQFVDPLPGEEFQRALSAADILLVNELHGVRDMAVPSKLTSYFNAGRPVIAATDASSVTASEILASGGGIQVDPSHPQALVRAAEDLGRNPELSSQLSANGLKFREETLSEAGAVRKYNGIITSLASSRNR